jgi:hypothetical protein
MIKHGIKYCHLSGLKVNPGEAKLLLTGLTQNQYIWCEKLSFSTYCHYN